jgi:uncharacterized protein YggU (UPF0235/DUF167 family)
LSAAVRARPWVGTADSLMVAVRLTPKGGRDALDGIERLADGHAVLAARVRAAPSDGAANAALVRLIAKAAGVAPSRVAIVGGAAARIKRVKIAGDPASIAGALEKAAVQANPAALRRGGSTTA